MVGGAGGIRKTTDDKKMLESLGPLDNFELRALQSGRGFRDSDSRSEKYHVAARGDDQEPVLLNYRNGLESINPAQVDLEQSRIRLFDQHKAVLLENHVVEALTAGLSQDL